MAAINDLISQIQDETLRNRIQEEVSKMAKQKKFGLVFEEHMPESTPLYDMPIKSGCNVMRRDSKDDKSIYVVLKVEDDTAVCVKPEQKEEAVTFELKDIVRVAEFGESIYPYLKPLDSVCNAPDSDLWHTLIEADNYHALQLLEYLYAGKVDCIYIDPPYNTGAKDWKYNNDYVDGNDAYRHSKWLSFMQRRLQLAKKLLNPKDSVLIVTIDEKEYLHLGCLLEEMFPEAHIQMVNIIINKNGVARTNEFKRSEEYAFFIMFGDCAPVEMEISAYSPYYDERNEDTYSNKIEAYDVSSPNESVRWERLVRGGPNALRTARPNLFYPIYIDEETKTIQKIGNTISLDKDWRSLPEKQGLRAIWPLRTDGTEATWRMQPSSLQKKLDRGCARVGEYDKKNDRYSILYLADVQEDRISKGDIVITGKREDGSVIVEYASARKSVPTTIWGGAHFSASEYGSKIITKVFGDKRFQFPKSFYATKFTVAPFVANKPNALIVDFFAGSGTTMHAVNLLNAEDGGHRRCIMVTNNEVSADEAKMLKDKGYQPGDAEWEKLGIAHYVTWPRTVCSIKGQDVNGNPLKGDYLGSEPPMHMADGFKANAAFFKLGFLDPTAVSLGMRISEMLPTLWLKTGAKGKCPELTGEQAPDMLILPENQFAVLINENTFADFAEKLAEHPEIQTVFLATDYEVNYQSMVKNLNVENAYQLYRDYLDHFRVNRGRN
jgi:adenine-specific DNA-methyltransferase